MLSLLPPHCDVPTGPAPFYSLQNIRPGNGFEPKFEMFTCADVNGENEIEVFTFLKVCLSMRRPADASPVLDRRVAGQTRPWRVMVLEAAIPSAAQVTHAGPWLSLDVSCRSLFSVSSFHHRCTESTALPRG